MHSKFEAPLPLLAGRRCRYRSQWSVRVELDDLEVTRRVRDPLPVIAASSASRIRAPLTYDSCDPRGEAAREVVGPGDKGRSRPPAAVQRVQRRGRTALPFDPPSQGVVNSLSVGNAGAARSRWSRARSPKRSALGLGDTSEPHEIGDGEVAGGAAGRRRLAISKSDDVLLSEKRRAFGWKLPNRSKSVASSCERAIWGGTNPPSRRR